MESKKLEMARIELGAHLPLRQVYILCIFITNCIQQLWSHLNTNHTSKKVYHAVLASAGKRFTFLVVECSLSISLQTHVWNFFGIFSDLAAWMQRLHILPRVKIP